jgi:cell division protein FtsB
MNEQIKSFIEAHKQALARVGHYLEEAAFDLQRMIDDEDTELATLSAEEQEREEENSDERKSEIERALDAVQDTIKLVQRISLEPIEEEAEEETDE